MIEIVVGVIFLVFAYSGFNGYRALKDENTDLYRKVSERGEGKVTLLKRIYLFAMIVFIFMGIKNIVVFIAQLL